MATLQLRVFSSAGGALPLNGVVSRTANGAIGHEIALGGAKSGTLSTRTNNTDGILTLAPSHGLLQGDLIDIYWADGVMYGAVVGEVVDTSVPFVGAKGINESVLPPQGTAVTCQKETSIDTDFDADLMEGMAVLCGAAAVCVFYSNSGAELELSLIAGEPKVWYRGGLVATNPMAGKLITRATVSQGGTGTTVMRVAIIYNSTT